MHKLLALALFTLGLQVLAIAGPAVPEIDSASATSAIALLAGVAIVIRGRRR